MARIKSYNKYTAFTPVKASAAINEGDNCYISATTGLAAPAVLTAVATQAVGIASRTVTAADVAAGGDRARLTLYTQCEVEVDGPLTPGGRVFADPATPGGITQTEPSTAGNIIQPLGWARDATHIVYNVVPSVIAVQVAGNSDADLV